MNNFNHIYKVNFMNNRFNYVGTLMNEKKFNMFDPVFFAYNGNRIAFGVVRGIYLPPVQNAEYVYKIHIDESIMLDSDRNKTEDFVYSKEKYTLEDFELRCDKIFLSIEEAKESAIKDLEKRHRLQKDEIERYFSQFDNKNVQ